MCFDGEPTNVDWKQEVHDKFVPLSHKLDSSFCASIVETWLNSWTTTERLQLDNRRQCIFRCRREDALCHFLRCDPLCLCITQVFEYLNRSTAQRLGIVDMSLHALLQVVIAFRVYHAMQGRQEDGSYSNDMSVEMSWAFDLMKHLYMEMLRNLRRDDR